jgi:hypothetical protein
MMRLYVSLSLAALVAACGAPDQAERAAVARASVATVEVAAFKVLASTEPVADARPEIARMLKGNWVPVSDTCTPEGGESETAVWFLSAGEGGEETISGAGWTCTFPRRGVVSAAEFSGTVSCGFGEGIEGSPEMTASIGGDGILKVKQSKSLDSEGGEIQGWSESYKFCSERLTSPY